MVKEATAVASKVNIGSIDMKLVKRELVTKELVNQGESKKVMESHSPEGLVSILKKSFEASHKTDDLTKCVKCQGISPESFESCPYCGHTEPDEEEPKKSTALAKSEPPRVSGIVQVSKKYTEKDLDEATAKILELKQRGTTTYWQLGHELGDVYRRDGWKLRSNDKGEVKYKSFKQYVDAEIKLDMSHVMNMMDIANKFSESDVSRIGTTKLKFMLELSSSFKPIQSERQALMADIEKGASVKDVKAKVREIRKKHGATTSDRVPRKDAKKSEGGKKGRAKQLKAASGKMTVSMVEGVVRLDMFVKPAGKIEADKLKDQKRAKIIDEKSFTIDTSSNGIMSIYSFLKVPKGWVLKIERRRA